MSSAAAVVDSLGAHDVLFFRRLRRGVWSHVSGVGRGAGWAGTVAVAEDGAAGAGGVGSAGGLGGGGAAGEGAEPVLRRALGATGVVRLLSATPARVVGPYFAGTAAVLRVDGDLLAVWGHPGRSERLLAATDEELSRASADLVDAAEDDTAARRLSDELAVLHAVQELTASLDQPLPQTLHRVAAVLAEALGCALAAAWVGDRCAVVERGWRAHADAPQVAAAAAGVAPPPGAPAVVRQDSAAHPLPPPLSPAQGVVSHLLLGLDVPGGGGVVAVHTTAAPRGFTELCQRTAAQLTSTASVLLQVALARERVEQQLHDARLLLGRDALTDVGSRHRWDEELARAQQLVDGGTTVSVALLDLDDLKWVNDTHGHPAGDALLRACAAAVRGCLRGDSDVVARVGGDEFAVLVPRATDTEALAARLRSGVDGTLLPSGLPLRVSIGVARCGPGQRVADAFAEADAAMYADKRRRRDQPRPV
ncbi:diguanylate cyclase [Quadrisphaera sp. DSM 44207]|uniref:GGDEF domain-containing protein n=1 Tax=Quadrisphaera sp. DSM 44207 TaxID=1881057 RepID=UPI00088AFB69|nr:GGDEF domain-containing protein [Quadrisphaera sp. DSM 44207]SDQ73061.1 diguanylate cyclase (GGDEF) domain-containing protein [Quadrisphaera sp. DSM 44207]